jgi:RNA polymerase sigma factor (sigma-70 family)
MTMTLLEPTADLNDDAALVTASRWGDREAFGRIVRRYQGMVTGVIFAACGDLHRSEDLAQETFIAAWKSLSGLREPAKLPAWLCQVARHRVLDDARSDARRDARQNRAIHDRDEAPAPSPQEELLSQEERELLWKTLREIPQPYRETMVLFYRQGKSAADVAAAMQTTEANVRQRLTRGREMLREQVVSMLERNLARSAPGVLFTAAVVASLPAFIPQAATAATLTAGAAKGTAAAAKGAGLLTLIAMWIGPLFGFLGGAVGTWASIRSTEHPRERQYVVRMSILVWVLVLTSMGLLFGLITLQQHYHWSGRTSAVVQSTFWAVYGLVLVRFVVVSNRRHATLRRELGLPRESRKGVAGRPEFAFSVAGIGSVAWMFAMAAGAGDQISIVIVSAFGAAMTFLPFRLVRGRPVGQVRRFALNFTAAIAAFTMIMVNWRLRLWMAAASHITVAQTYERIPTWAMNVFAGVICGFMLVLVWATMRSAPSPLAGEGRGEGEARD